MFEPIEGKRALPTGETLRWFLTDPGLMYHNGLVPFFIDWGQIDPSKHPSSALNDDQLSLVSLEAESDRQ